MKRAIAAGARGRRRIEVVVERASGRLDWVDESRQGVVPVALFGDRVRAIA